MCFTIFVYSIFSSFTMSVLDAELKSILQKNDVEVERFLRIYIYRAYIWRFIKWLSIVTGFLCAIYWVPILNWNASAIGRLGLIHSVHPFYNWEHLANARCLVDMGDTSAMHTFEEHHNIDPNSVPTDTCSICENLSKCSLFPVFSVENLLYGLGSLINSFNRSTIESQLW